MLITLKDDNILYVYESEDDAVRDVRTTKPKCVFHAVFDEHGQGYSVRFSPAKKISKLLRGKSKTKCYLTPTGDKDRAALLRTIAQARTIAPQSAVEKVKRLVDVLAAE